MAGWFWWVRGTGRVGYVVRTGIHLSRFAVVTVGDEAWRGWAVDVRTGIFVSGHISG